MVLLATATVASMAPMASVVLAKAPASTNIHTMYIMRVFAAPFEKLSILSFMLPSFAMIIAYTAATRNATAMGMR